MNQRFTHDLESPRFGGLGEWEEWTQCANGQFVTQMKIIDDTYTNGDRLGIVMYEITCTPLQGNKREAQKTLRTKQLESPLSNQTEITQTCSSWINGVRVLYHTFQGCMDDKGVVGMEIYCATKIRDERHYLIPSEIQHLQDSRQIRATDYVWSGQLFCPANTAMCGIRVQLNRNNANQQVACSTGDDYN
jgi:hypothetical protein